MKVRFRAQKDLGFDPRRHSEPFIWETYPIATPTNALLLKANGSGKIHKGLSIKDVRTRGGGDVCQKGEYF